MSEKLKKAFSVKNKFDELNEKGSVRISEKSGTPGPDYVRISGKPEAPIVDRQVVKGKPMPVDKGYARVKGHASGKLGALAALGTLGYQALKGEPVMAQDVFKHTAEAINPLPFSMSEIKEETEKMNPMKKLGELQGEKEVARLENEKRARPGAMEFKSKFASALKKGKF